MGPQGLSMNKFFLLPSIVQKQSFTDVLQNRCYQKFHKFHWKIPVLVSLFNKAASLHVLSAPLFYRTLLGLPLNCPQMPVFTCSQNKIVVLSCHASGQAAIESWRRSGLPKEIASHHYA